MRIPTLLHRFRTSRACDRVWLLGLLGLCGQSAFTQTFTVNTANREEVRTFFNTVYRASEGVPIGWTGSLNGCNAGTVSQAYLDATLLRVNFFRAMAGVATGVVFDPELNRKCQLSALMMTSNDAIEHEPPKTWTCYTAEGAEAAGSANLSLGRTGPASVYGQMQDGGANNTEAGHRRWILFPSTVKMGSGSVPDAGPNNSASSVLWVIGNTAPARPATRDEYVAWPPPGFVPYTIVFPRWSFSLGTGDFSNATVTMQRGGAAVPVVIQARSGRGIGDPTIVWVPNNLPPAQMSEWPKPAADETYTVNVGNVMVNGTARNFTYNVTIIDHEVRGPDAVLATITGPDNPTLNQSTTYNFNPIPSATGYQWQAAKISTAALSANAENGLGNFEAATSGNYNPVDTTVKASGNAGFRLVRPSGAGPQHTLTFKPSLLANANSQITFKSRFENIISFAATVDVSTDGGANWVPAFTQIGTEAKEGVFSDKVVSLAAYAGREIKVRFSLAYLGGVYFTCCDPMGWYFDDVNFVNLNEVTNPVVTDVTAGTSFAFNPTEQSEFNLSVRPRIFGQYLGEWGPAKRVSTLVGGGGGGGNPNTPVAPTVSSQPQGQTVNPGVNVTLTVVAQGSAPLAYVWKRNGTDLSDGAGLQGARTASLTLQNVQAAQAGSYTVQISNGAGNVTSTPAVLIVSEPLSLATALDTTGLTWNSDGNTPWTAQTATSHDNVDAAQSGRIGDNQESRMETTVNGPATVAFWWKVDSEQNFDFLRLDLDGTMQFRISGGVNWEAKTVAIPTGSHTLRWVYSKDASDGRGADAGWVDQVEVRQAQPPPSLADALDNTDLPWATAGDRPWFAETTTTHDGTDAVQSGPVLDNQTSRLEATVLGPANLTFWWKVDSEPNYDFLAFELDSNRPFDPISGNVDWQQKTVPIPAGTHTIRWVYLKDTSASNGADAGWVDQVVVTKLTPGEAGEPGPTLEYTASGAKLRITWPEAAEGFKLQSTPTLGSGWTDVPENEISKEAGVFFIQVNSAAGTRFYRLIEIE